MGLYALPIIAYSLFFKTFSVIVEILSGTISFMFYQPTYLIILSTYALCRMDDLSWGTKGLESGASNQSGSVEKTWNKIKTIHVGKYLFWNIIVAAILIHFGSNYLLRFWLTFALMILIGSTMLIKVLLALAYYVYYYFYI
jgi:chitin synthase